MNCAIRWIRVAAVTLVLACSPAAEQQEPAEAASRPRACLEATETLEMASLVSRQAYRIDVALPHGYEASEADYPVLYLLDSDVLFGLVTDVIRLLPLEAAFLGEARVPELIVVGIGYPGGVAEMSERRGWDFNPPEEVNPEGAENFLRFLTEQLVPRIEADYRAASADRTLVGASRAGVFVLSTLLRHPEAFGRYLAISPIVDPAIFRYEEALVASGADLPVRLFLSAGDRGQFEAGIARDVGRLTAVLEGGSYPGMRLVTRFYTGESHVSVVPGALVDGLVAAFSER